MIDVHDFIESSEEKFNNLIKEWIDMIDWSEYSDKSQYTVKYFSDSSDICSDRALFSSSILRHIDAKKCLFPRLLNNIPQGADRRNYTSYFFKDDKCIMSEFELGSVKEVTLYLEATHKKLYAVFFVRCGGNGQESKYFNPLDMVDMMKASSQRYLSSLEYSAYDDMDRLISDELYEKELKLPFGVSVTGEYYEYNSEKLTHAVKYSDYNKKTDMCPEIMGNVIFNPEIYHYNFEYNIDNVICRITRKYAPDEDYSKQFEVEKQMLKKLSKHGIKCFGI